MKNTKSYSVKSKKVKSPKGSGRRKIWWLGAILVLLIAGFAIYKWTRPDQPKEISAIPTTNANQQDQVNKPSGDDEESETSEPNDKSVSSSTGGNNTIVNLAAPSGTFVNTHKVSASQASNMESICNTTPGATCSISFTSKDGVIRYLPDQKVDENGAAYWTWTTKTAKLTAGSWQIKATAKSGDKTKSTNDPIVLEVKP